MKKNSICKIIVSGLLEVPGHDSNPTSNGSENPIAKIRDNAPFLIPPYVQTKAYYHKPAEPCQSKEQPKQTGHNNFTNRILFQEDTYF